MTNALFEGASPNVQLKEALVKSLEADTTGGEAHMTLERFAESGGSMNVALATLQSIREDMDEEQEDLVLEIMDCVVGWCHPDLWIWRRHR